MDFCPIKDIQRYTKKKLKKAAEKKIPSDNALRRALEWLAVLFNLLFTWLYINRSEWAFAAGILGPTLLLVLSYREKLYAEPVLQVVYIISAAVGWLNVQKGWVQWQIGWGVHLLLFLMSSALAAGWGVALRRYTTANFPILDALVASWGMLATWLMMYQVHACWLYLLAVNALSIFIYSRRRLFTAACMFVLYFIMSIDGYFQLHWFEL
jgi:nicotinamide mononucleotide transporter